MASVDDVKAQLRAKNLLTGKRIGRLQVIGEIGPEKWLVHCDDCGKEYDVPGPDLRKGIGRRPCGCDDRAERGRRLAQRRALRVFLTTVLVFAAALGGAAWMVWHYPDAPAGTSVGATDIDIPKGAGARQVAEILHAAGLVDRPAVFRLYAGQRGVASRFRAGRYHVAAPTTPRKLLELLVKGVADELVSVTIPEGKNILDVAEILDAAKVTPRKEFIVAALDKAFAQGLGLPGDSVEGYLFPDTYRLRPGTPAQKVITTLVHRQRQVMDELKRLHARGMKALSDELDFDEARVVTLASIVEKETGQTAERPRIAQVFLNRLRLEDFKPKLLQTDPTIIYGCTVPAERSAACRKFEGRIRRIHLDDKDNRYNTYTHEGLPPGPISNPGRAALEAVLSPDGSPYLYFVAKNDGTHQFSKTVAEHEAAVDRWQRGK